MVNALIEALCNAVAVIRERQLETELGWVLDAGDLSLLITTYPDGAVFGEFCDDSYSGCWDGCNGISTVHRSGWCRTNPEHADFDCGCNGPSPEEEAEFYDWLDEQQADERREARIEDMQAVQYHPDLEPF